MCFSELVHKNVFEQDSGTEAAHSLLQPTWVIALSELSVCECVFLDVGREVKGEHSFVLKLSSLSSQDAKCFLSWYLSRV